MKNKKRYGISGHENVPARIDLRHLSRILLFLETIDRMGKIYPLDNIDILHLKSTIEFIRQEQREEYGISSDASPKRIK